jgi:hypothetical protein
MSDNATEIRNPIHTMPTQEELETQARLSSPLMGVHRKGECSVEARIVQDGYAYRLMGADSSDPWEWMRTADFMKSFIAFSDATKELQELKLQNQLHGQMLKAALGAMNKRCLNRFTRRIGEYGIKALGFNGES